MYGDRPSLESGDRIQETLPAVRDVQTYDFGIGNSGEDTFPHGSIDLRRSQASFERVTCNYDFHMDEANIPIFSIYLRIRFYNKTDMKTMNILAPVMALLGISGCAGFKTVPVKEFEQLAADGNVQLVDVRTPEEFEEGHLTGSVNIDWKDGAFLSNAEKALDKSKVVAVYCRSGKRSAEAAAALTKAGFTTYNLKGGFLAWKEAGNLVVKSLPYEMDSFKTASGKHVRFYALVHASILIEYDGLEILVDPVRKLGEKTID